MKTLQSDNLGNASSGALKVKGSIRSPQCCRHYSLSAGAAVKYVIMKVKVLYFC